MKNLIAGLVFAAAMSVSTVTMAAEKESICPALHTLGASIMTARQNDTSLVKMFEVAKGNKIAMSIIEMAYDRPLFSTQAYKDREISSFANDVMLVCIKKGL